MLGVHPLYAQKGPQRYFPARFSSEAEKGARLFSQSFSRACSFLPFNTKQFLLADAAGTDFPISSIQAYTTRFCPISVQHN